MTPALRTIKIISLVVFFFSVFYLTFNMTEWAHVVVFILAVFSASTISSIEMVRLEEERNAKG